MNPQEQNPQEQIQGVINKNVSRSQFSAIDKIPFHKHNGSDSNRIDISNVTGYITGQATLVGGTSTITSQRITTNSVAFVTLYGSPTNGVNSYFVSVTTGSITLHAYSTPDTSTLNYLIIF